MRIAVTYFQNNRIVKKEFLDNGIDDNKFVRLWWNRDNIWDSTSRWLTAEEFDVELRKGIPAHLADYPTQNLR